MEYENREFLEHDVSFSSFAHLIGAVRCAASAIKAVPKVLSGEASAQMLQSADSKLDGWLLLMPEALKCVMSKAGKIDELMHQAFLVVHVYVLTPYYCASKANPTAPPSVYIDPSQISGSTR